MYQDLARTGQALGPVTKRDLCSEPGGIIFICEESQKQANKSLKLNFTETKFHKI